MRRKQPEKAPSGKWWIYHRETGERHERWPIDARDMLDTGEYSMFPADAPEESFDADKDPHGDCTHRPQKNEMVDMIDGLKTKIVTTTCTDCGEELGEPEMTPIEHSPGVPLNATPASDAGPAKPTALPGGSE